MNAASRRKRRAAAESVYLSANGLSRRSSVPGCAGPEAAKAAVTAEHLASVLPSDRELN